MAFEHDIKAIERKLKLLSTKEARNFRRSGNNAGAEVIRRAAADNLGPGNRKNIGKQRSRRESNDYSEVHIIGPVKDKWYLQFFEIGAAPHEIKPNRKKALLGHGYDHPFSGTVNHPGITPNHFLTRAVRENQEAVKNAVIDKINERIRKITK